MKNSIFIYYIFVTLFIGCENNSQENKYIDEGNCYVEKKTHLNLDTFYPFSDAKYAQLISYCDMFSYDTTKENPSELLYEELLFKSNITIQKNRVKESIKLNKEQLKELGNLMYDNECKETTAAACYNPRHSIVFYNKVNKPYAAIEVCLECMGSETTENIPFVGFCMKKTDDLTKLFESFGVKYFGRRSTTK